MQYDKTKVEWLEFELLEPFTHVLHASFFRDGGLSEGSCKSLNVGFSTSDSREAVLANRKVVLDTLELETIVYPNLSHGTKVERVTSKNKEGTFHADALFTTEKGIGICVTHADCQPTFIYDPMHEAIAVVHAGWRGLVQNIYERAVHTLQKEVGSHPQNLIVCIGPSLGPCHSEFVNYKQEFPKEFWDFEKENKHFDLWSIAKMQLTNLGVLEKNIEICGVCTYCNAEDCFSYRRDKDTGRHLSVIALKG